MTLSTALAVLLFVLIGWAIGSAWVEQMRADAAEAEALWRRRAQRAALGRAAERAKEPAERDR